MNTRRTFLFSLPLLAGEAATAQSLDQLTLDGVDVAKTAAELKKRVLLAACQWEDVTFAQSKFLFALTHDGDGASYIDLHGWIFNQSFKEWRRFLQIKTRHIGTAKLRFDEAKGMLSLWGKANNEFDGVEVFRLDLRATSDDANSVR